MREKQIKVTRRYHHTPIRMVKRKKLTIPSAGQDVKQLELSGIAGGKKNGTASLENTLASFYKVKHLLTI